MTRFLPRLILLSNCLIILFIGYLIFHHRKYLSDAKVCLHKSRYECLQCLNIPVPTYNYTVTPEEKEFPLAYSILVHTNPERTMQLLAAIYRPQNFYCIHVDRKTDIRVHQLLDLYGKCFNTNVFFVPDEQRSSVHWGYFTVLEPELTCARLLLKRNKRWKYWINLTGQEFPLRTNRELVLALKALNGTNLASGTYKRRVSWRVPPPSETSLNIVWYKGPVHVAVRREFVEYMLNDANAIRTLQDLKNYEKKMKQPIIMDETYFPTLNNNPHVFPIPGALLKMNEDTDMENLIRYKMWENNSQPCGSGYYVREICILGVLDLPYLNQSSSLFANKFLPQVEPQAYAALEVWLANRVSFETAYGVPHPSFNKTFYEQKARKWTHL